MLILVPETTDASISAPVSSAELAEIEAERQSIIETAKANGTYLKAPNGKDTNLTPEQWVNVRTKRFKAWFGDWENDPKNASKVVDANGEPKVVYHGTPNEFYTFGEDTSNKRAWTNEGTFYFTDNEKNAETYGKRSVGVFLNIRNPYVYDFEGRSWRNLKYEIAVTYGRDNSILASGFATNEEAEAWLENFKQENPDHYAVKDEDGRYLSVNENTITGQAGPTTDEQTQIAKAEGYDGNIQTNIVDSAGGEYVVGEDGVTREVVDPEVLKPRTNYVAFDPNQIKSATDNVGTYSRENNDIRYSLTDAQATAVIEAMKANAEVAPQLELTPENWTAEFGAEGVVSTPIGEVKMSANQYQKMEQPDRRTKLGMVKPTLTNPDVIIEEPSKPKDGRVPERNSSYVFVKAFTNADGTRDYMFTSVSNLRDGIEIVMSNQEKETPRIKRLLKEGKLAYINKATLPSEFTASAQGDQSTVPSEVSYSESKDTTSSPNDQTNGAKYHLSAPTFYSNAEYAVRNIKQEKATPEQWLKMIEKNGGLKAGEDKWLGLSDWLKASTAKTLTKDEVLQYIAENDIQIEEVEYSEANAELLDRAGNLTNDLYYVDESINSLSESIDKGKKRLKELTDAKRMFDAKAEALKQEYGEDSPEYQNHIFYDSYTDDIESLEASIAQDEEYYNTQSERADALRSELEMLNAEVGDEREINSTRLDYTTKGLDNKREIALVVPTIEPWNTSDNIHFGDAGEGRAIAWIRFGEAEAPKTVPMHQRVDSFDAPFKNVAGYDVYAPEGRGGKFSKDYVIYGKLKDGSEAYIAYIGTKPISKHETLEEARNAMNEYYEANPRMVTRYERVLVIDEIQSKRHQDGREKGYKTAEDEELKNAQGAEIWAMMQKYNVSRPADLRSVVSTEDAARLDELSQYKFGEVPSAPFEKNWAELAMKRMLRYAAENGFDKVAWTTGDQQADRYNIGNVVSRVLSYPFEGKTKVIIHLENNGPLKMTVNSDGVVEKSNNGVEGQSLADVVGKELANKIMNGEGEPATVFDGDDIEAKEISGDGLRIGGEGMKAFYDQMLPSFVRKYTKKWGATVGEVTMPNLEENNTMHSVDVTPAMRESVMQGQPKFSLQDIANDVREYDATNSTELYDWLNFVENGSIAKNKTQFHIANTGEILNEYGIKGKINVTRKAINAKRHTDNDDHKLGVSGWAFLVATINNPLAITQYNNEPNSYRIYTIAEINGKNICAGVDVNATNGVEITKITTAFGRDIAKIETSSKEEEIYRNENAAEQISGSDNSHLYARLLSTTKVIQNFESPNLEPKNSLITPQMDADYLSAVERGDMETVQRMVAEAAKLSGYNESTDYQGSLAFNGAAPMANDYFATKEERKEAWLENFKQENPDHYAVKDEDGRYLSVNENTITGQAGPTTDEQTQIAKAEGYDGNIQTNIVDSAGGEYVVGEDGVTREVVDPEVLKPRTNYVAFDPNQIKSATDNVGTYSRENNDIRYSLQTINALSDALTEYNANGDLTAFVDAVRAENGRIGGHHYLTNIVMDYEEDGDADWFEERIKRIVDENTRDYAPYTAGGVRYSIAEREVRNVVLSDAKDGKLPSNREEAFEYIPQGGISIFNGDIGANIKVGRKAVKHTALHHHKDEYAIFGAIRQIVENAVKIGNIPVAEDEIGHTHSVNIMYVPINVNGTQYSARLLVKELENKGVVLEELSLYNVSMHKEKGSAIQPLNASSEVGGIIAKPKSVYKVKDLIHNSQELDKKNLGINTTTHFSLITPQMDADYLSAVERGDMETAQRMVMEAAKLAMPNTKVVDEDPVTYDDNGNVIPLSERFNPEEADVRYSVPSNPFGGNSGYVGYSMSKRAAEAREEGRYPKTDFKKIYNIPQTTLDALVEAGVIYNKEWHHTSVWGNKTIFYGWGDEGEYPALAEYYKQNKKAIDKAVKEGADISEYIKGFEDAENALWEAERQKAIETANRIEEERKKSKQRETAIEAKIAPMYKTSNGAEVYTHQRMYTGFWEAYKDGERLSKRNRVQERDAAFAEVRATIDEIEREYDTHFSLQSEKIFSAAKEKFGTTYDMREAGYILPDGSMLDFSGRHQVRDSDTSFLNGRRTVDHREIEDIAYDFDENETGVTTDMGDFLDRGAIRIDYNVGAINLNVAPTKEQRERLKRLIERNSGDVTIDFGKGWDTEHYAEYEGARASRVLGDIDRYFDEGIKSNGNVRHSLESVQPYATYAANMARTLNIEQPIFVADTAEEFVRLMRDAGSKDPDRVRVARGVYRYKEDAIFINAENFDTPEAMYNSILHEWTHGYTHRNIDKLEAILSTLDEERVKKSGAELLPKFYKNDTPLTILNEIISRFVERIPKPLLLATMRGQMPVEDLVNGLVKEIKGEEFADIIEAVSPVIKENLINQKDRYNGRREEPIVIARWSGQENNEGDEGVKGYLHRRRERGFGEHGHSQYHPAFDRRGESEDAQEVDYRHSIEEIIDTPSDEEYKQKMLALAQQMERDAESRGLDVAQQIADTTGWVHLDDGTWKYYGDVDITEDAQEVTRYIIAYTVSSISHVI